MLHMNFFSDEVWFYLTGYVNSQNTRIWSTENLHSAHETPLHPVKTGVWCAVPHCRIVGPIFLNNIINLKCDIDIAHQVLGHLTDEKIAEAWFQQDKIAEAWFQDSTTCNTAWATIYELSLFGG
jgi:hypothetical protein